MFRRTIASFATVALIGLVVAACSSNSTTTTTAPATTAAQSTTTEESATASGTIAVTLADVDANTMLMTPNPDSAPAGEVTFDVTNSGNVEHEFVVIKTVTFGPAIETL